MRVVFIGLCVVLVVVVVCVLYCLAHNSSCFDREKSDKEQDEFLKHYGHKRTKIKKYRGGKEYGIQSNQSK